MFFFHCCFLSNFLKALCQRMLEKCKSWLGCWSRFSATKMSKSPHPPHQHVLYGTLEKASAVCEQDWDGGRYSMDTSSFYSSAAKTSLKILIDLPAVVYWVWKTVSYTRGEGQNRPINILKLGHIENIVIFTQMKAMNRASCNYQKKQQSSEWMKLSSAATVSEMLIASTKRCSDVCCCQTPELPWSCVHGSACQTAGEHPMDST